MKEMREGCNNCGGNHTSSEYDDQPMVGSNEGEVNYVQGGYRRGVDKGITTVILEIGKKFWKLARSPKG
jgi:hypothetical protein